MLLKVILTSYQLNIIEKAIHDTNEIRRKTIENIQEDFKIKYKDRHGCAGITIIALVSLLANKIASVKIVKN